MSEQTGTTAADGKQQPGKKQKQHKAQHKVADSKSKTGGSGAKQAKQQKKARKVSQDASGSTSQAAASVHDKAADKSHEFKPGQASCDGSQSGEPTGGKEEIVYDDI